jgi:exosome complex component RRP46
MSQILPLLQSLLTTSLQALLSASIPLKTMYTTTLISKPTSQHVFATTGEGEMLVAESEGDFGVEDWEGIVEEAKKMCEGSIDFKRGFVGR